jgi:hypothetical protein
MEPSKVKVYVGCSLTHAPEEFRNNVEELKNKLKEVCQVLLFKGLSDDHIPHDVYVHDIVNCVHECDILVAICDYPSIGLGWEMSVQAEKRGKPVLAVAHKDSKISMLILDPQLPGYEFRRYDNLCNDVFNMVVERIKCL